MGAKARIDSDTGWGLCGKYEYYFEKVPMVVSIFPTKVKVVSVLKKRQIKSNEKNNLEVCS